MDTAELMRQSIPGAHIMTVTPAGRTVTHPPQCGGEPGPSCWYQTTTAQGYNELPEEHGVYVVTESAMGTVMYIDYSRVDDEDIADTTPPYAWEATDGETRIGLYASQETAEAAAKRQWREANLDDDDETAFDWWVLDEDEPANELAVDSRATGLFVRRVEIRQGVPGA